MLKLRRETYRVDDVADRCHRHADRSRSKLCVPSDCVAVTGPGTAITVRPGAFADFAIRRLPLRNPASTITTPAKKSARLSARVRNRIREGTQPGGYSLISTP